MAGLRRTLLTRLLLILPFLFAVGVWAGHQSVPSRLLETHPSYPIKLLSIIPTIPDCPAPIVKGARVEVPLPVPIAAHELILQWDERTFPSRGPPAA